MYVPSYFKTNTTFVIPSFDCLSLWRNARLTYWIIILVPLITICHLNTSKAQTHRMDNNCRISVEKNDSNRHLISFRSITVLRCWLTNTNIFVSTIKQYVFLVFELKILLFYLFGPISDWDILMADDACITVYAHPITLTPSSHTVLCLWLRSRDSNSVYFLTLIYVLIIWTSENCFCRN